ncbi:hypothetical protein KDA00_01620 [Candidatus Saccharibacteria bacterium]|nr:hypothetical protein [Candidatus Saccharibacteria bacterium]
MSMPKDLEILGGYPILEQLAIELRDGYDPPMDYHNWDGHILKGLIRINEIQSSGMAIDVNNWFVVRAAYIGHDWGLTSTKKDPTLLDSYDCAEEMAAEKTRDCIIELGLGEAEAEQIYSGILGTNPNYPCETPEAKAICRVDLGNTGDSFEIFLRNFFSVQLEDKRIDQLLINPRSVVESTCNFLRLYLRRSELVLGPNDTFPSDMEKNILAIQSMGTSAIRSATELWMQRTRTTS